MAVMPQTGAPGIPGAPTPPMPPSGPTAAPMSQPTPNDGERQMGMVNVESAMQMLEQALGTLGSNTEEGKAVLEALTKLSKSFSRPQAAELVPAQVLELARKQRQSPLAAMMEQPAQPQAA